VVAPEQAAEWEELAKRGAQGDENARKKLVEQLWPVWIQRVRTRKALRVLSASDDHVHNIVARLVQKLLNPEILQSYAAWRQTVAGGVFRGWLFRVTDNEVHDYVRTVAGRVSDADPAAGDDEPSPKLFLNEFSSCALIEEQGRRPMNTELQTASELLRFAQAFLPKAQTDALGLWLQGASDDEIDAQLRLTAGSGKALRRAAIARLRREFGEDFSGETTQE